MLDSKCPFDFNGSKTQQYKDNNISANGFNNWTRDQSWRTSYGQSHCNEVKFCSIILPI